MATSGSYDFGISAATLIQDAMENIGVVTPGGTVPTAIQTAALRRLNFIAKQFQGNADMAQGLKVHTRQRITLALAAGQQSYLIGPASTDARASTAMGRTTLSAAEASGQTTLSITSNTDTTTYPGTTITMTNGDFIGIELDDGTIQWTTISGTPGATATVSVALTGDAASGNYVWWFTSRAQRFPVLETAVLRDENRVDMELAVYRDVREYELGVPDKYAQGDPWALLVEPLRIATRVTLSSQPEDVTKQIILTALYPAEGYDATTDDIAFPQEWFAALSWELSFRSAPSLGRPWTDAMDANRTQALTIARELNPENTTAHFEPGRW